jgi:hypothetical protein
MVSRLKDLSEAGYSAILFPARERGPPNKVTLTVESNAAA